MSCFRYIVSTRHLHLPYPTTNVVKILKTIHAQETKQTSWEKAAAVFAELESMKLPEASRKVESGIEETLTYYDFPSEHWGRSRTNHVIERMNHEIRRRTRVVGVFRLSGGRQYLHDAVCTSG